MPEDSSRARNTPVQTKNNRPKISLANQAVDIPTDPQSIDTRSTTSKNSTDKIPTFIIWSIFNLLFVPFGIACCFFSYKVRQFKRQNRTEIATKWSKRTFVINIMTTLLMFGVIVTVVMLRYDYNQRNPVLQANDTRTTGAYIPWQPGR